MSPDGISVLTQEHFLIGQSLRSPPVYVDHTSMECNLKGWNLINHLKYQLWTRCTKHYLQTLQQKQKWQITTDNLRFGNIVLHKVIDPNRHHWPLARIIQVHQGREGCIRVMEIVCNRKE